MRWRRRQRLRAAGRLGYLAYAAVHVLVAWLAIQVAFGRRHGSADVSGALTQLAKAPAGTVLLALLAVGFAALAAWRIAQTVRGAAGIGHDLARRIGTAAQAALYLAFTALMIGHLTGAASGNASSTQRTLTARLLSLPGGQVLVVAIGVGIVALGAGLAGYGVTRRFTKAMSLRRMPEPARRAVVALGAVGYLCKGLAYAVVGVLVVAAAVTYDPAQGGGLDSALHTLAGQPYGRVLLVVIALGFAGFALFTFARVRYQQR